MITYTEFEAKVKKLNDNLNVRNKKDSMCVYKMSQILVRVGKSQRYSMSTMGNPWDWITSPARGGLYALATELAATPINKRVETPKRYYYVIPHADYGTGYMNYDLGDGGIFYDNKNGDKYIQTKFTEAEYVAIAKEKGIPDGYHIPKEVTDDE